MKNHFAVQPIGLAWIFGWLCLAQAADARPQPADAPRDEQEFETLFDGKTLDGWNGESKFWSVEDGAITGRTTAELTTSKNTFLIWSGGALEDFELRVRFRIASGNSGIQYRSKDLGDFSVQGYQADLDAAHDWIGTLYEERGRGVLAKRGCRVRVNENGKPEVTGETTPQQTLLEALKPGQWHEYTIVARGNRLVQKINGHVTVDVTDQDPKRSRKAGILALQLHTGPPMKVQFKDIRLKRF